MAPNEHREAASWHLASELVREQPTWQITHTIPIEGGGYDCLSLTDTATGTRMVEINRPGSVLLPTISIGPEDRVLGHKTVWDTVAEPGGTTAVLDYIRTKLRLSRPRPRPASTPEGLTYRVIASMTALTAFDEHPTRVESCMSNHGPRDALLAHAAEAQQFPPERIWVMHHGGRPTSTLAAGWAWTPAGERLNLAERRGRGQSIEHIAGEILSASQPTRRGRIEHVGPVPAIRVPTDPTASDLAVFAESYNGYSRMARGPHELYKVVRPVLETLQRTGRVPDHAGLDLTRAALFYRAREARHSGDLDDDDIRAWAPLLEHIRRLSNGTVALARDVQPDV